MFYHSSNFSGIRTFEIHTKHTMKSYQAAIVLSKLYLNNRMLMPDEHLPDRLSQG